MEFIGIDVRKRDSQVCILAEACKLGAYRLAHRTLDVRRHMRAQLAVREALVRTRTPSACREWPGTSRRDASGAR